MFEVKQNDLIENISEPQDLSLKMSYWIFRIWQEHWIGSHWKMSYTHKEAIVVFFLIGKIFTKGIYIPS